MDEPVTLTPIRLYFISVGFGKWLSQKLGKPADTLRISIGRDPRISGKTFQTRQTRKPLSGALVRSAVTVGLASIGVSVSDFGLASTPAMFMSCILEDYSFDGAIMLTASHLPFNRNGMKFFDKTGGLDKPDIKQILQLAAETCIEAGVDPSKRLERSFDVDLSRQRFERNEFSFGSSDDNFAVESIRFGFHAGLFCTFAHDHSRRDR